MTESGHEAGAASTARSESTAQIAVFGSYSDHDLYQRNRTLVALLQELCGSAVLIRPHSRRATHAFSQRQGLWSRLSTVFADLRSLYAQRRLLRDVPVVFVPYPAYLDLLLLRFCPSSGRQMLLADAFLELKSTVVDDRKMLPSGSYRERLLEAFQRFSLSQADVVLIDTVAQAALLERCLSDTHTAVVPVPVGIDESQWHPLDLPRVAGTCRVLFWGTFIPLHGVEYIVAAARILASRGMPVELTLIGDGQVADALAKSLASQPLSALRWERRLLETEELRDCIAASHIVLGVFGDSQKAGAVVPYKVHQALASNRPVITRGGDAMDELADAKKGLLTCAPADPEALAQAVETLWLRLQEGWTPTTRSLYDTRLSRAVIRDTLASVVAPYCSTGMRVNIK